MASPISRQIDAGRKALVHEAMHTNAREAIERYLSMRPSATTLHRVYASGMRVARIYAPTSASTPTGVGDAPSLPCPNFALTPQYQQAVQSVLSAAPTGLPVGGATLDPAVIQQTACQAAQQFIDQSGVGLVLPPALVQKSLSATVDAESIAASMGDILHQISQGGFNWQTAAAVAQDTSAMVGSITAILVAVGASTSVTGVGLVVSAAVGLVAVAISVLAPLLSKPPQCESMHWHDTQSGQDYPGRIERLCVDGPIIPSPTDPNWRSFPTTNDVLFGFGGWFDLPHDNINLKDRSASWKGLTVASDDDAAHYWRPIDLAFGDYRRLECEAALGQHPWVERQGWNDEQKTAVYAFMAYFFEMWKKAAEARLNGLPADWRNMLASAILHWNMAHDPGTQGPIKLYTVSPTGAQQGPDCNQIVTQDTPPLFLMIASDAYGGGTSITEKDPGVAAGSAGYFSGSETNGTFLLLHTGDSRARHIVGHLGGLIGGGVSPILTGGILGSGGATKQKGMTTAGKVAVGTVVAAGATAAGIGVYAWMHGLAYNYVAGKLYDATVGKVVDKAKVAAKSAMRRMKTR